MFDGGLGGLNKQPAFSHLQSLARSTWFEAFLPYDILCLARAGNGGSDSKFVRVYFSTKNDRGISLLFKVRVICALVP